MALFSTDASPVKRLQRSPSNAPLEGAATEGADGLVPRGAILGDGDGCLAIEADAEFTNFLAEEEDEEEDVEEEDEEEEEDDARMEAAAERAEAAIETAEAEFKREGEDPRRMASLDLSCLPEPHGCGLDVGAAMRDGARKQAGGGGEVAEEAPSPLVVRDMKCDFDAVAGQHQQQNSPQQQQ